MKTEEIEEIIEWHERVAADGKRIAEATRASGAQGDKAIMYFGERSAKTASALRFLLKERELRGEALGKITVISHKALEGGNHMQGLVWIKKACFDAGFVLATPQREGPAELDPPEPTEEQWKNSKTRRLTPEGWKDV